MRLIDADTMHKPIYAKDDNITGYGMTQEERDSYNEGIRYALRLVANCLTVDAVPVVRCGKCKHSKPWYRNKYRCFFWVETGIDVFENGFCSYGKPKGGDE